MKQKYRLTFRCDCGNEFKKITTNKDLEAATCPKCKRLETDKRLRMGDGAVSDNDLIEPRPLVCFEKYNCNSCAKTCSFAKEKEGDMLSHCPKCGSQDVKYMGEMMFDVPSQSAKNAIKALDITAKMTMDTFKMNDLNLNSSMREGDSCAPKLPPRQQQMVNGFFDHGKLPVNANFNAIGKRAIAGAYRDTNNPVANLHQSRKAPKFDLIDAPTAKVKRGASISSYDNMLQKH